MNCPSREKFAELTQWVCPANVRPASRPLPPQLCRAVPGGRDDELPIRRKIRRTDILCVPCKRPDQHPVRCPPQLCRAVVGGRDDELPIRRKIRRKDMVGVPSKCPDQHPVRCPPQLCRTVEGGRDDKNIQRHQRRQNRNHKGPVRKALSESPRATPEDGTSVDTQDESQGGGRKSERRAAHHCARHTQFRLVLFHANETKAPKGQKGVDRRKRPRKAKALSLNKLPEKTTKTREKNCWPDLHR